MKLLKTASIIVISMLLSFTIFADSEGCFNEDGEISVPCVGEEGQIPGVNCCANSNVPFDGGVGFLIAAGLSAGGYSIFKKKKKAE